MSELPAIPEKPEGLEKGGRFADPELMKEEIKEEEQEDDAMIVDKELSEEEKARERIRALFQDKIATNELVGLLLDLLNPLVKELESRTEQLLIEEDSKTKSPSPAKRNSQLEPDLFAHPKKLSLSSEFTMPKKSFNADSLQLRPKQNDRVVKNVL